MCSKNSVVWTEQSSVHCTLYSVYCTVYIVYNVYDPILLLGEENMETVLAIHASRLTSTEYVHFPVLAE